VTPIVRSGPAARLGAVLLFVGPLAFSVFLADVFTGWAWNIGLFERAVIYPIRIGHVLLGRSLAATSAPGRA
jgi:hypothetical protein